MLILVAYPTCVKDVYWRKTTLAVTASAKARDYFSVPSSDGVKNMTHEAKAKGKAMTRKAKAKAKDLTL